MGYLKEYIEAQRTGGIQLLEEAHKKLIKELNQLLDCETLIFATSIEKAIPETQLNTSDYEAIYDLLSDKSGKKIVVYLETPGGMGHSAEDIACLLHDKYKEVHFLISGEAKSAGTILALSGDEILMTKSGSLGPIDAQMQIGRSKISAHGYMDWVVKTREQAEKTGRLNIFDAQMIAQISPGELQCVENALKFAIDLVKDWLPRYKFKNWTKTETREIEVTPEMRAEQAEVIANQLTRQDLWRSHGRSLKIDDLDKIGLQIIRVDEQPKLAEVVYRIQAINRITFGSSSAYKIFSTADERIQRNAVEKNSGIQQIIPLPQDAPSMLADVVCPKCSAKHKIYFKLIDDPGIDKREQSQGNIPYPKSGLFKCLCGTELDLTGIKTQIENISGKKVIIGERGE